MAYRLEELSGGAGVASAGAGAPAQADDGRLLDAYSRAVTGAKPTVVGTLSEDHEATGCQPSPARASNVRVIDGSPNMLAPLRMNARTERKVCGAA